MFSREQRWAQTVSGLVLKRKSEKWGQEYGRQCLRLPAMIHECGLCQTVAFLESKAQDESGTPKREHFRALLEDMAEALEIKAVPPMSSRSGQLALLARTEAITEYQRLTRNALHCANYLKRYAEAILKVQVGDDSDSDVAGEKGLT